MTESGPARHPLNAPGPFYVELGCCTACMAPHDAAPRLMGMGEDGHCFIARQPTDDAELYGAMRAIAVAELRCIRYGGTDVGILARLAAMGEAEVCDHAPPADVDASPRTHVVFTAPFADEWDAAAAVRGALERSGVQPREIREPTRVGADVVLETAWFGREEPLRVSADARGEGRWVVSAAAEHPAVFSLGMILDDGLRADERISELRWYTAAEWRGGRAGGSPWPF